MRGTVNDRRTNTLGCQTPFKGSKKPRKKCSLILDQKNQFNFM